MPRKPVVDAIASATAQAREFLIQKLRHASIAHDAPAAAYVKEKLLITLAPTTMHVASSSLGPEPGLGSAQGLEAKPTDAGRSRMSFFFYLCESHPRSS